LAGLRQSEAANLVWRQISGKKIVGLPSRGNAPSSVEIGSNLLEILNHLPSGSPGSKVFPNIPRHASQRTRELQALSKKHPQLTFNVLRHSFGANLILQGASLETVRQRMRFSMLEEVVQVYGGLLR